MLDPLDFHTHHGAFGAYGSFTLGKLGAGGGFQFHDGRAPAKGAVYVGVVRARDGAKFLPFSRPAAADLSAFAIESVSDGIRPGCYPDDQVRRRLDWATDSWSTPDLAFRLATPFGPVPDPRISGWESLGDGILPAVWAELELDNSRSDEDALLVFALDNGDTGQAPLAGAGWTGIAQQGRIGIATPTVPGLAPLAGFSLMGTIGQDLATKTPHWLGTCWGFSWKVASGAKWRGRLVLGWYHAGEATSGLSTRYGYTRVWPGIEQVLARGLEGFDAALETAGKRDRELSAATPERRWLLAHATRGYFGNSELLATPEGAPVYVVNEGEYCMMNTLDLSVDQGFFEAGYFPWVLREILDLSRSRYSFVDCLKLPESTAIHAGGISFTHDMGVRNQFSEPGSSSYEMPDLEGCFSHMTFEQACNWSLIAGQYAHSSSDSVWAVAAKGLFEALLESLERREHPDPAHRKGHPGTDSTRCGRGTEITTYDSLDPSLAQTRDNLYTTVKLWASYLALERLAKVAGGDGSIARAGALRCARAVETWPEAEGFLPAIADGRNLSAILPAVEGLVYPLWWGDAEAVSPDGPFGGMVRRLGTHLRAVLDEGHCRFPDGGWKISSTSDNSWLSKIFLAQAVAEGVFGRPADHRADKAHLRWEVDGASEWGFTDQMLAGKHTGSRFYPRGVTAILLSHGAATPAHPDGTPPAA